MALLRNGKKRREKKAKITVIPAAPPGELTLIPGIEYQPTSRITLIDFWGDHFLEKVVDKVEDCFEFVGTSSVTWINVERRPARRGPATRR